MVTRTRVSLKEFLAMPETEPPSELIEGEVIQKMSPNFYHSKLTAEILRVLGNYLVQTREADIVNELRHIHAGEERVYLPDINVTLRGRIPNTREVRSRGPIPVAPDFAIEVLSPGQDGGRVLERADFYMRSGTRLLWFVNPESEAITVYRPGAAPTVHRAPGQLDAAPVLRDFHLDVASLFAVLHEDDE